MDPDTLVQDAYMEAVRLHGWQMRKGTQVPYMIHVLGVAEQLALWGVPRHKYPEMWAATMLHDVVEDCDVATATLAVRFGPTVAAWVEMLTFRSRAAGESSKDYQLAKTAALSAYGNKPVDVLVIKLADRFRNVQDFMVEDRHYALTYLERAKGLTDCIEARRAEIVAKFSEDTFNRIKYGYDSLTEDLYM